MARAKTRDLKSLLLQFDALCEQIHRILRETEKVRSKKVKTRRPKSSRRAKR